MDSTLPVATGTYDTRIRPEQPMVCGWPKDAPDTPPNPSTWGVTDQNGLSMAYCRNAYVAERIVLNETLAGQVQGLLDKIASLEGAKTEKASPKNSGAAK